ncbi:MAG: ATP-binding protein [Bacteroidales bacterium]|nr:ATP-binding protein [Bacteroidales bacterium]HOY38627.1 ATP-binding protein [Bacteroidales bacterium]HQP04579.1 ATP-binding protein [Bacteroidales bacterium]
MEIAVISGKGGTGKSSISAAFATLPEKVVLADCDVDAANLYILFNPTQEEVQVYIGGQKAEINYSLCTNCKLCIDYCRFGAISLLNDKVIISDTSCDGCKLCSRICPASAISMIDSNKSRMYAGTFRNGKMVYGRLAPGEENSGKLVNIVRDKAKTIAKAENIETIIIDGPPGIGCPVISTITGVDHVVIVTEPTISGIHDLKRTIEITTKFNLKTWVIINKYDLNSEMTNRIEDYCNSINISIVGKLLFNPHVVEAMVNCKSVVEYAPKSDFATGIKSAYNIITNK